MTRIFSCKHDQLLDRSDTSSPFSQVMVAKLILDRVCEVRHHTEDMLQNEGFDQVFCLPSRRSLALSVLLLLGVNVALDIVKSSKPPDSLIELRRSARV